MKSAYKAFFIFLKNPKDKKDASQSIKSILLKIIVFWFLYISISVLTHFLVESIDWVQSTDNRNLDISSESVWTILIVTAVITPIIEEFIFRYPLRYKKNLFLIIGYTLVGLFHKDFEKRLKNSVGKFWDRKFGVLFYSSAIIFGLFHLINYNDLTETSFIF